MDSNFKNEFAEIVLIFVVILILINCNNMYEILINCISMKFTYNKYF